VSAIGSANPPHLVSPVEGLNVRAVLDQDAVLTSGLAVDARGRRAVVLVSAVRARHGERDSFIEWMRALESAAAIARIAELVDYGHTPDGRPYMATYTDRSLVDMLRQVGSPERRYVRDIGIATADALAFAHSYGVVHGAVSPATILLVRDGVRLGGFGATAPGLTGPLGLWAFTAPEHRAAAAAGEMVGSPAGDVFSLAATMCVALAGVLPWSDPVSWADTADVPAGPDAPAWALALRAALSVDPEQRPTASKLAHALRTAAGSTATEAHDDAAPASGVLVDLRGLIPRQVRRLAANSIDAMSDGPAQTVGRATPAERAVAPADRADSEPPAGPAGQLTSGVRQLLRTHRGAVAGIAAIVVAVVLVAFYFAGSPGRRTAASPTTSTPTAVATSTFNTPQLLDGARQAGEAFLHNVGTDSNVACLVVHGTTVITVGRNTSPITCPMLLQNAKGLLGPQALRAMSTAKVLQAVAYPSQIGGPADTDPHAFVSLPYVPALEGILNQLDIVLTFHADQWWVVQATFA
jgi:hypothetical protein